MDMDIDVSRPFAMIDEITEASPAAEDGLQLGDQVVKFGNVEIGENLLQRLAAEVQKNQSTAVPLVVMRQGALITLSVTPRAWSGRGLLGYAILHCLVPLIIHHQCYLSWTDSSDTFGNIFYYNDYFERKITFRNVGYFQVSFPHLVVEVMECSIASASEIRVAVPPEVVDVDR